jgi:amino-acid N-acetyltransferase
MGVALPSAAQKTKPIQSQFQSGRWETVVQAIPNGRDRKQWTEAAHFALPTRRISVGRSRGFGYILRAMNVRFAKIADAKAIYALINSYAERDRMLFRSMADIYENLQAFVIVEAAGSVIGCCALEIIWSDLAEIKSLAVDESQREKGVGKMLVGAALERARELGLLRVFALTLEPNFFERLGFAVVEKEALPMKVWSDCAKCSKQQDCDEIAVIISVLRDA